MHGNPVRRSPPCCALQPGLSLCLSFVLKSSLSSPSLLVGFTCDPSQLLNLYAPYTDYAAIPLRLRNPHLIHTIPVNELRRRRQTVHLRQVAPLMYFDFAKSYSVS